MRGWGIVTVMGAHCGASMGLLLFFNCTEIPVSCLLLLGCSIASISVLLAISFAQLIHYSIFANSQPHSS